MSSPTDYSSRERMRLAVPMSCPKGHRYYREAKTEHDCPFCMKREINELKLRMQKIQMACGLIYQETKQ